MSKALKAGLLRFVLATLALLAVGYPLYVWYSHAVFTVEPFVLFELFPAFGLFAFSTMWLHVVGGAFRQQLEKLVNYQKFVSTTSFFVLVALILHPGLLLAALLAANISFGKYLDYASGILLVAVGMIAWVIFIAYDVLKIAHKNGYFDKYWSQIKLVSTLAFFLVFIHSLALGRDLHVGTLKYVWWFYGITAALATYKTYFTKPH